MHSGGLHPTLQDEIHLEVNAMRMKPSRVLDEKVTARSSIRVAACDKTV